MLQRLTGPPAPTEVSTEFLHFIHEAISLIVLTAASLTILVAVGSVLFSTFESRELAAAIGENPFLRRVIDFSSVVGATVIHPVTRGGVSFSRSVYKRFELEILDKLNHIVAKGLSGISLKLRLKFDVVGDYYTAIIWFVGGALVSIILLFLA